MSAIKRRIKTAAGWLAGWGGAYRLGLRDRMLVTAFHRVNDTIEEDGITCSSAKFEAFCKFLARHFRVVPLSEQIEGLRCGDGAAGTASITFDDGYLDNYEVAAPILREYGLPATFFVTAGFIGSRVVPEWDKKFPIHPGWMNWDQVRELARDGFEVGCHTVSHIDMGRASLDGIRDELIKSREVIEQCVGAPVRLFAYPFGGRSQITQEARNLVRELGFDCCASCYGGTNSQATDPYSIQRIGVGEWFSSPQQFGFELLFSGSGTNAAHG